MVDTRAMKKQSIPRKKPDHSYRTSAYKVDDDDEWNDKKPVVKRSKEKKSEGLSITPVATKTKIRPKKEEEDDIWSVNMNYISAGSSADSDDEENNRRTRYESK